MKLIYVTASLPYGTQEAFIVAEVNALVRLGHEVLIVPRSPRGPFVHARDLLSESRPEKLVSMRVLGRAAGVFLASPRRVARQIGCVLGSSSAATRVKNLAVVPKALWLADLATRWQADHIHCHWAATTASMTLIASNLSGVSWSLTAHRWDIVENNLLTVKAKDAAFMRVISNETKRMAQRLGVEDDGRLRVLPMGVDIPTVPPREVPHNRVILCPANLVEVKGHRFLLAAWRMLRDRGVTGELWLAGGGPLKPSLQQLIRDLDLEQSVKMLGALPHDKLLRLYEMNCISAVALASVDLGNGCHEGIPVALIEAMGYGVPVVSTRTGAIAELVLPESGLLVPPRDPAALADALEKILENDGFAQHIGHAGQLRATQAHNITAIAEVLERSFTASSLQPVAVH